jgi:hypothetical protein
MRSSVQLRIITLPQFGGPRRVKHRLEGFYQEEGACTSTPLGAGVAWRSSSRGGPCPPRRWRRWAIAGRRAGHRRGALLEDGSVELLSPQIMRQLRAIQPEEHRLRTRGLNHPDSTASYCLAAMLTVWSPGRLIRRRHRDTVAGAQLRLAPSATAGGREARGRGWRGRGRAPAHLERWAALLGNGRPKVFPQLPRRPDAGRQADREQGRRPGPPAPEFWRRHWRAALIVARS